VLFILVDMTDLEDFRPWLVMALGDAGTFKTIGRHRFRNNAEGQVHELNKRAPGYFLVAFEAPKNESDRRN
jgi:hypothetical protein